MNEEYQIIFNDLYFHCLSLYLILFCLRNTHLPLIICIVFSLH